MKYSVLSKYNMEILTVKLQKNEQPVENEILWIRSQQLPGIVPMEVEQKGGSCQFKYNMTGFISLKKYTRNRITRNDFALLMESIVQAFEPLQEKGLTYGKLLLEEKGIYINPVTKKAVFIYIPVNTYDNGVYIEKFLQDLVKRFKFEKNANMQFLQEFNAVVTNPQGVSWEMIKNYVKHLKSLEMQKFQQNRMSMPQAQARPFAFCVSCGAKNAGNAKFCVKCGKPLGENKPMTASNMPQQGKPATVSSVGAVHKAVMSEKIMPDDQESQTTVLGNFVEESEEATTVLNATPHPVIIYPYFIREKTQEKIQADKEVFVIGKGKASDYVITGNNAVSRNHLSLITRDNHYYIVDNHSTNMTFIGDEELVPEKEYEVFPGTKVRMADEEFTLYADKN
ncbi:MAG: FHA domain-containing protein [Lachnospira sp.]|nr:FHA domain-containing protein [Lachnospira sp.]